MKTILKYITFIFSILKVTSPVLSAENFMKTVKTNSALVLVEPSLSLSVLIDSNIDAGVKRSVVNLVSDVDKVSDYKNRY